MAWLTGYSTRIKLTVDNDLVDSELSDFPVLVKLTSNELDFSKANSDGFDIRFTEDDGETLLKYERERHDSGNSLAEYWVKVPTVSDSAATDFYMYYRTDDTADGADPTNVWDANFQGVWHLNQTSGNDALDSTSNSRTAAAVATPVQVEGQIGKAQDLNGSTECFLRAQGAIQIGNTWTFEGWINGDDISVEQFFELRPGVGTPNYISFAIHSDDKITAKMKDSGDVGYIKSYTGNTALSNNTWYYVTVTWDGTNLELYLNGSADTPYNKLTDGAGAMTDTERPIRIGAAYWSAALRNPFDGTLDDMRMSSTARSVAWVKASYHSGNDGLLTYGTEETESQAYTLTAAVGAFVLTGINVLLIKALNIICAVGNFTLTGINVAFTKALKMTVAAGGFVLTGIATTFTKALNITASVGSFILTGISTGLERVFYPILERLIPPKKVNYPSAKEKKYQKAKKVNYPSAKELI